MLDDHASVTQKSISRPPASILSRFERCGQPAAFGPQNKWRPFCSERCKLVDLGQWASEGYRVAGSGLGFEDVGEHDLKGVPERWRLYRVVSDTARSSSPPRPSVAEW